MRSLSALLLGALLLAAAGVPGHAQAPGDTWTEPISSMEFVWVPGGCFQMGCGDWTSECFDSELPVHEVCVDGFWMGRYEVTQDQWRAVMNNSNPSRFQDSGDLPVERVSWNRAHAFLAQLMDMGAQGEFRLPTEAEWEYACRGGGQEQLYAGGEDLDALAWWDENAGSTTHAVGTKAPNSLGIHDMSGNVWEWVLDSFNPEAYAAHAHDNPLHDEGRGTSRVRRGGSWDSYARYNRCSARDRNAQTYEQSVLGFRVVRVE